MASDVAATKLLFTSLLVQGTGALQVASHRSAPGSHTRSRAFRSSFWLGFVARIDQRLAEIAEHVLDDACAEVGDSLLPVLAASDAKVSDAFDSLFGPITKFRPRGGYDPAGRATGRLAADAAQLNAGSIGGD